MRNMGGEQCDSIVKDARDMYFGVHIQHRLLGHFLEALLCIELMIKS